jgi:hypothetical protein
VDFDAFRADVNNNGSISQTELNQYCQDKFSKSNSMNLAGVAPTSCNPLDGTQAVINATGVGGQAGEFTGTDLSRVSGLTVNFNAALAASQDKFRLARADNTVRTISSALVTPRTLMGAGATLQSQGCRHAQRPARPELPVRAAGSHRAVKWFAETYEVSRCRKEGRKPLLFLCAQNRALPPNNR